MLLEQIRYVLEMEGPDHAIEQCFEFKREKYYIQFTGYLFSFWNYENVYEDKFENVLQSFEFRNIVINVFDFDGGLIRSFKLKCKISKHT